VPAETRDLFDAILPPGAQITVGNMLALVRFTMPIEGRAEWLWRADALAGPAISEAVLATIEPLAGPLKCLREPLIPVGEPVTEASAPLQIGKQEWTIVLCVAPPVAVRAAALLAGDPDLVSHTDTLTATAHLLAQDLWPRLESFLAAHDIAATIAQPRVRTLTWERSLMHQHMATCIQYFCVGDRQPAAAIAVIPPAGLSSGPHPGSPRSGR
jgi:hypothetical protein